MANVYGEGIPIPDVIDPPESMSVTLCVPKNTMHLAAFFGALYQLTLWNSWQRNGTTEGKQVADVWWRYFDSWNQSINDIECEAGMAKCCVPNVEKKRFDPVTGRPQVSYDGGDTWQESPDDPQNLITLYPPLVVSGGSKTKCDAATNASEHVNELITKQGADIGLAGDVFSLAVAVSEAILGLVLIIFSAGTLTAPVVAVATAIWAACQSGFAMGEDLFNAYWTVDKKDAILCAIFCNIGEDGQFTESQYQAFRAKVKAQLPASPALDMVMTAINAVGARGMSQMASYGNAAEADCSSCDCDECSLDVFVNFGGTAEFVGMAGDECVFLFHVNDPDPGTAGRYTMNFQFDASAVTCVVMETLFDESTPHSGVAAGNCAGGSTGLPLPMVMNAASVWSDAGIPWSFKASFVPHP